MFMSGRGFILFSSSDLNSVVFLVVNIWGFKFDWLFLMIMWVIFYVGVLFKVINVCLLNVML